MATVADELTAALALHRQGERAQAERGYRRVLRIDPQHADALHLLGVIAQQNGDAQQAVEHISRAIAVQPRSAVFHNNLGAALLDRGQSENAAGSFRRALALQPNYLDALLNLARASSQAGELAIAVDYWQRSLRLQPHNADIHLKVADGLQSLGRLPDAMKHYDRALKLNPDRSEAHNNRGVALLNLGDCGEAIASFERAVAINPAYVDALRNLGVANFQQGNADEAVAAYQRVIGLSPADVTALTGLGDALKLLGQLDAAAIAYRSAIGIDGASSPLHDKLGLCLHECGQTDEAINGFRRAVGCDSSCADGHGNLGAALLAKGRIDDALGSLEQALAIDPGYVDARFNRGLARLLTGDWERGWADYECRRQLSRINVRDFPQPLWDGSPLNGRTILLHAEQGLGDTLQFVRYVSLVRQQVHQLGGRVLLLAPKPLLPLLKLADGFDQIASDVENLPLFDVHAPLLSLPGILCTTLESVPADVPYLAANTELTALWEERLQDARGLRVGINWQGDPNNHMDRTRSIPLMQFAPLADVADVSLISLQKGPGSEQLSAIASQFDVVHLGNDVDETAGAFMDTAAIMQSLDLVITSDTSIAHLAGGLGVPVWVALSFVPEWRWLRDRDDSPWYPTVRLFRQPQPGDWPGLFADMQSALSRQSSVSK